MKTVQLTTWERIQILQCVPPTCLIVDLPKHLRVVKIVDLSPEEAEIVGLIIKANGSREWQKEMATHLFDIEFEDADFEHTMKLIKVRTSWPTSNFTLQLLDKMEDAQAST